MMNFGAVAGLIYMGYKGLRSRLTLPMPFLLSAFFVIWTYIGQASLPEDQQNWTAMGLFVINFSALLIARIRGLGSLNFTKAVNMWGTSDKALSDNFYNWINWTSFICGSVYFCTRFFH